MYNGLSRESFGRYQDKQGGYTVHQHNHHVNLVYPV